MTSFSETVTAVDDTNMEMEDSNRSAAKEKRVNLKEELQKLEKQHYEALRTWRIEGDTKYKTLAESLEFQIVVASQAVLAESEEIKKLYLSGDDFTYDDIEEDITISQDHLFSLREDSKKVFKDLRKLYIEHQTTVTDQIRTTIKKKEEEFNAIHAEILKGKEVMNNLLAKNKREDDDMEDEKERADDEDEATAEDQTFQRSVKDFHQEMEKAKEASDRLFVPQNPDVPILSLEDPDGNSIPTDEHDPKDLWSPSIAREKAGISSDNFRLEAYKGTRIRTALTGRGPPNSTLFRLQRFAGLGVAIERHHKNITIDRWGEMKTKENPPRYMYGEEQKPTIQGVAWLYDDTEENPLDMLLPRTKEQHRAERVAGLIQKVTVRRLDISIKVKWMINGVKQYSWETRTTIRRLWGYDTAELYIYKAAEEQENRYKKWANGERKSEDRSPTPGRTFAMEPSVEPESRTLPLQVPTGTASNPISVSTDNVTATDPVIKTDKPETKAMEDIRRYMEVWCVMNDVEHKDMTKENRKECMAEWKSENF